MNETPLYLKPYFFSSSSQPLNVDTFSELIDLLLQQSGAPSDTGKKPVKFPHVFLGNPGYELFVRMITTLHPKFYINNIQFLNKNNMTLTSYNEDLHIHQSSSKNQNVSLVISANNLRANVLGFQTIVEHEKNKLIYSFTWNLPKGSSTWDLEGQIFCIPSTVVVKRDFELNDPKRLKLQPLPNACFDTNASYFLFSLTKDDTQTQAVALTYSSNPSEQQFEHCHHFNRSYSVQTQPRALYHIDKPALNPTLPRQEWNENPYRTLSLYQPCQTPALSEPARTTVIFDLPPTRPLPPQIIIIQDNLHEIHQHPLPPIEISVTKNYNNTIPQNRFYASGDPNQYCGQNLKITYNPNDDQQAQRISFSFGIFNKNDLLIGTRLTYLLTSGKYALTQEYGIFYYKITNKSLAVFQQDTIDDENAEYKDEILDNECLELIESEENEQPINSQVGRYLPPIAITDIAHSTNELICGTRTQYCSNGADQKPTLNALKLTNSACNNTIFSQVETFFRDVFKTNFQHSGLTSHEKMSVGHLDKPQQAELDQLSRFFNTEIDAQFREVVQHQIARVHHCLDVTKSIAILHSDHLEHVALFDKPSKVQIMTDYKTAISGEWRTMSHSVLEKIRIEEQRAWQSLIKKQAQLYLTLQSEHLFKQKIDLSERMLQTHEWIQVMYRAFFQHAFLLFQSIVFEKERGFLLGRLPMSYATHISRPQRKERSSLCLQFTQETQEVLNRPFEKLIRTERLHRRFLMFSLSNEYTNELTHYHQKQTALEHCKLFFHGESIRKQVHHYIEHMTIKLPDNHNRSIVELLQMAYKADLIHEAVLTGSAARGSALANDIDLKIFVKHNAKDVDYKMLLNMLSPLILASTKRYIRTDNALLTLEFMGPNGLPFNLVIFFIDNKKSDYPPLYQDDIVVRFDFTTASWQFFHETVDYSDQSDKKVFSLRCQAISEPEKIAKVLSTQSFNMKRYDEPGAILRVFRDMTYSPGKEIYNEKNLMGIWQNYNTLQKENIANMVVLFLNGDDDKKIPAKIHAYQQTAFKLLVSKYFPNWEHHCGHQATSSTSTSTFFRNNKTYFGIAAVIEKIGNASGKVALENILSDIETLGIDEAVGKWRQAPLQRLTSTFMHP